MPLIILWATIGLCFGSFANVLVYRLPRKISVITPPSACRACKNRIPPCDLLPLISYILLKGRCRKCNAHISPIYPLTEVACAALFVGMLIFTGFPSAIFLSVLAFILLTVSLIDWHTQEIPDGLLLAALVIGIAWAAIFSVGFIGPILGILAGAIPLLIIDRLTLALIKKDGFGYGDVKLMAVAGLYLGVGGVFTAFFFAFVAGGIFATFLLATGRARRGTYIAFGPFLCGGIIAALWFGQALKDLLTYL